MKSFPSGFDFDILVASGLSQPDVKFMFSLTEYEYEIEWP